jgi:hypothetical protein
MTFIAVLRAGLRSLAELLMASDALFVKCIRFRYHLGIFDFAFFVAIQTAVRLRTVFDLSLVALPTSDQSGFSPTGMMMAIRTVQRITVYGTVRLMVKKDFSRIGLVHDPNGFGRCFGRKGGIADNRYKQQVDCQTASKQQLFLRRHVKSILFGVGL